MNQEILALLEYIEQERGIDRDTMLSALHGAIKSAAKKSVDLPSDELDIAFDNDTGEYKVIAYLQVVENEATANSISLEKALVRYPKATIGETVEWEVTPHNFGRIAAQAAKQAMMQQIRKAEKEVVFEEFQEQLGKIVNGEVRRYEGNSVIVDLGKAEGILSYKDKIPNESYFPGDRINALLRKIDTNSSGINIILSRSHSDFVRRLFEREVAEISEGIVKIKGIARDAGQRTKIAVYSEDKHIDPIGACVGLRGMRVRNITNELGGEKIDIIEYSDSMDEYVANALQPASLESISIEDRIVDILVKPDQLSLAIGKKGQNVRLTSRLLGCKVNISSVEEEDKSFEAQIKKAVATISKQLDLDQNIAEKLVRNGFNSIEGIKEMEQTDLEDIEDLTEEEIEEILNTIKTIKD
jgi:N utilization substance protein A